MTAYIAKQKIFNRNSKLFAYELLFRDSPFGIKDLPSNIQATSQVLMNTITNSDVNKFIGKGNIAFINVDETVLMSGVLDILDKNVYVIEVLETIDLTPKVLNKLQQYRNRGFKIAIDDFDCSAEMIKKFTPILKYVHIIKIDVMSSNPENLKILVPKLKVLNKTILAEKIETKEEYDMYLTMGFDLFQGYYLHKPEVVELNRFKDVSRITLLELIKIVKNDGNTTDIEKFIKQNADMAFKLIKYLNNHLNVGQKVESLTQVITLLGRDKLLRWLMLYFYAELSENSASGILLSMATKRAEAMEADSSMNDKDRAYLAGMFSMLDVLFVTDIKTIMADIAIDKDITQLVVEKKGKFADSLQRASDTEREHIKVIINKNFDKLCMASLIHTLDVSGVKV